MSDIKLFRTANGAVEELEGRSVAIEKSIQKLIERHLEAFLGVQFLASEFSTGPKHGGRVDLFAEDEDGPRVIIENQLKATDHKHLGQGLIYLSGLDVDVAPGCVWWLT
jgi:RecB family endonuclease NucS